MMIKLKTKSSKVNALSFHSKEPWILASLDSGGIELWDYRVERLIHRFDEHEGPVRAVHFHESRPLFVSGGDDCKVKLWNYKTRKCLFPLLGHDGSIRTVQFHHEFPWILSASADKTIRIWNWLSRTTLSVLEGHTDPVMCASFHPHDSLIVSASLDKTVRVWDIGALSRQALSPDAYISGGVQWTVKHVFRVHDRGVNWACFHRTKPLVASCADDLHVLVWRFHGDQPQVVGKLRSSSMTSVMFHPVNTHVIVATSKERGINVWDTHETESQSFLPENEFWTLAVHPEINLLAAGHDSGMIVFKLSRDRPAFVVNENTLFYAKDHHLRQYDFSTQKESQEPIRIHHTSWNTSGSTWECVPRWNESERTLSYCPIQKTVLISSDVNGGSYETCSHRIFTGNKVSALILSSDSFAVLEKGTTKVQIQETKKKTTIHLHLPHITHDIFYAGFEKLLCRSEGKLLILDVSKEVVLCELQTPLIVKYVVWSADMERVAMLSKRTITIASKLLVLQCTLRDDKRVKSGAWDEENGVFIYTTLNHIKYCLPNGESGIIRTLEAPMYVTKVSGNRVFCLDRKVSIRIINIDTTEYVVKLALLQNNCDSVRSKITSSQLCGQAMVAYLQQKGFPELAYLLAEDEKVRFDLAIESGKIGVALKLAEKSNDKDLWHALALAAIRHGQVQIAEHAYAEYYSSLSMRAREPTATPMTIRPALTLAPPEPITSSSSVRRRIQARSS